jgi:molybdate transport system substrate-binding protein
VTIARRTQSFSFSRVLLPVTIAIALPVSGAAAEVRIFAAASLTDALSEVAALFEVAHPGARVVPQFGGSSDLARQILAGAPADLFFSADEKQMDRVAEAGLLDGSSRRDLLSNELVIVAARESRALVRAPDDLLHLDRVAMADPESVPAGVYSKRYLEERGLWKDLARKVVPTLDVRGALAAVASGNVDAGFVYRTDASIEPRVRVAYEIPRDEGPEILYPVGVMRQSTSEAAPALLRFLETAEAKRVFEKFGFIVLAGGDERK